MPVSTTTMKSSTIPFCAEWTSYASPSIDVHVSLPNVSVARFRTLVQSCCSVGVVMTRMPDESHGPSVDGEAESIGSVCHVTPFQY